MPDYMFLLESRLSPEQRGVLVRVQELAQAQGVNVYLTGGAVRDLISGMPIRDLDFIVEGNPFRMARELEKGGAVVVEENERLRHVELIFAGDVDGSIASARDDVYDRPGTKPEISWSTVMEDLRRRDFSINAIAISLNLASRGLLLDPTNGLADLEKHEIRALSIHGFTNQPIRLLRALRYSVRMGFKMEARTAEWFALALERGLHESISGEELGREIRQLAREDKAAAILKAWGAHELLGVIHPQLARRHPDYDGLAKLAKTREAMVTAGLRPRLFAPVTYYLLAQLKSRERSTAMNRMEFRTAAAEAVTHLEAEAEKVIKLLSSRKAAVPRDAFFFLDKVPPDLLAFVLAEYSKSKVQNKIRNFLHKWKPLRTGLAAAASELDSLGVPRGAKFDKILEDLFDLQLRGKGRTPQDRTKLLRKLAGIKPEPKKKPKPKKKEKSKAESEAKAKQPAAQEAAAPPAPPESPPMQQAARGKPATPAPRAKLAVAKPRLAHLKTAVVARRAQKARPTRRAKRRKSR